MIFNPGTCFIKDLHFRNAEREHWCFHGYSQCARSTFSSANLSWNRPRHFSVFFLQNQGTLKVCIINYKYNSAFVNPSLYMCRKLTTSFQWTCSFNFSCYFNAPWNHNMDFVDILWWNYVFDFPAFLHVCFKKDEQLALSCASILNVLSLFYPIFVPLADWLFADTLSCFFQIMFME